MNPALTRRGFLSAVAAGVTAALAPMQRPRSGVLIHRAAASELPIGTALSHDGTDFVVQTNGTMMMWQQMLRDYSEAEQIGARVAAIDVMLDHIPRTP